MVQITNRIWKLIASSPLKASFLLFNLILRARPSFQHSFNGKGNKNRVVIAAAIISASVNAFYGAKILNKNSQFASE